MTLLLVEDSRFAAEGIRLLCRRLGIRLRRAQSLADAQAHLRVYRPDIALVDIGMPDGSGLDLIRSLGGRQNRPCRVVATSGDLQVAAAAQRAGADAFVEKPSPVANVITALLGPIAATVDLDNTGWTTGSATQNGGGDPLALRDDLRIVRALLAGDDDPQRLHYVAQFLSSIARLIDDSTHAGLLSEAAASMDRRRLRAAVDTVQEPCSFF